jgi:UPF0755 protein
MRALRLLLLLAILSAAGAGTWMYHFATQPLVLPATPFDFTVRSGSSVKSLSRQLAAQGLFVEGESFWILARILGKASSLQAGTYRLDAPLTPVQLLDKLARGDVMLLEMQFVEGTTFRQWLAQIAQQPHIRHTLQGKADADVRAALALGPEPPEGLFFPDTYRFAPGVADVDILKRAQAAMKKRLAESWEGRDPQVPLENPYQALILASIIEKETGAAAERPIIASVFANRLRKGMRLQTDPTVIYGMGETFDGNIRRKDLTADTPWNTYTRDGLPPTPIAMPGLGSLRAAVHPAETTYLYFVSKGDGSHQFTSSLEEHNRAVARYQLKR